MPLATFEDFRSQEQLHAIKSLAEGSWRLLVQLLLEGKCFRRSSVAADTKQMASVTRGACGKYTVHPKAAID